MKVLSDIFLSDLHIGNDSVTNLYQSSTDQANLKKVLQYIQNNGSQINDVVILGDWVDLWMYPSSVVPPTVQQIFAANPAVFNRQDDGSGDFVTCMDSIQGNLCYVNGNHDITVTEKDINDHFIPASQKGKKVHYSKNGYQSGKVYGEHGNRFSMLCRPYNGEALPLGYYVTRAGMQIAVQTKQAVPAMNVGTMQQFISYNGMTCAEALLTLQANQLGIADIKDMSFVMPDGSTITGDAVAAKFPNLSINDSEFLRADVGGSLNVAAKDFLITYENRYNVLVFGHTHIKELQSIHIIPGIQKIYANTGFMCANTPNANGIPVTTFVEIEDKGNEAYTVSLMKVDYATGAFSVDKALSC